MANGLCLPKPVLEGGQVDDKGIGVIGDAEYIVERYGSRKWGYVATRGACREWSWKSGRARRATRMKKTTTYERADHVTIYLFTPPFIYTPLHYSIMIHL